MKLVGASGSGPRSSVYSWHYECTQAGFDPTEVNRHEHMGLAGLRMVRTRRERLVLSRVRDDEFVAGYGLERAARVAWNADSAADK